MTITEHIVQIMMNSSRSLFYKVYDRKRVSMWYVKRQATITGKGTQFNGRHKGLHRKVFIGGNVHINDNFEVSGSGSVVIGQDVHIGPNVTICTNTHDWRGGIPYKPGKVINGVTIGSGTWIGRNVLILPGTQIGTNCVIQAGSTIFGRIPSGSVVSSHSIVTIATR